MSYAGVITKFLQNIKDNKSLKIFGTGEQIRDFVHVEDVADANLLAMNSEVKFGFYNIGTGVSTSINQLAKIMIDICKQDLKLMHLEALDGDIKNSSADIMLTKEKLNWKARIKLQNGLERFFEK